MTEEHAARLVHDLRTIIDELSSAPRFVLWREAKDISDAANALRDLRLRAYGHAQAKFSTLDVRQIPETGRTVTSSANTVGGNRTL